MSFLLIKGGRLIDPLQAVDGLYDIVVEKGRVKDVLKAGMLAGNDLKNKGKVIDAEGLWVIPGMIDMHCHLREPGEEYKETIKTGTTAAVAGGYTSLAAMANTIPVNDNASVTDFILNKASVEGAANVLPVGTVTRGMKGESLVDMGELKDAGVVAFSDDGRAVMNSEIMRRALEYSKAFDLPIISHCEDTNLSGAGVIHEGYVSAVTGLKGMPSESETVMIGRDIALAELTGGRLHIAHVSTAYGVELIREAKARGVNVTAEVTPHHLTLTDDAVRGFDTAAKVNPPLRGEKDREALINGLEDGTIDVIATDHAPHSLVEKDVEFDAASSGMIGLETSLSLCLSLLFKKRINLSALIEKLTKNPARILGLERGALKKGFKADIAIIDPNAEWVVDTSKLYSKSANTPFRGWKMRGRVVKTIVNGKVVYG